MKADFSRLESLGVKDGNGVHWLEQACLKSNGGQHVVFEKQKAIPRYALVGTGVSWIDTGIPPTTYDGFKVEVEFAQTKIPVSSSCVFGSRRSDWATRLGFSIYGDAEVLNSYVYEHYLTYLFSPPNIQNMDWNTLVFENGTFYMNGVLVASFPKIDFTSYYNLFLFAINFGGSATDIADGIKIRKFKITKNVGIVRDFIPVIAGSTLYSSTPAPRNTMWDTVTQQYMPVLGTGAFGIEEIPLS